MRDLSATSYPAYPAQWRAVFEVLFMLSLFVLLAACGGSLDSGVASSTRTSAATALTATSVALEEQVRFTTEDGVALDGTLYGRGTNAIILSNEGDNASDPWHPVARQLAAAGYVVLHYSYRAANANFDGLAAHALIDLRGAISFLHTRAVTRLTLVGASLGALASLKAAASIPCDALVSISAPVGYQDVRVTDADLGRLVMPKLFVTSAENQPFSGDTERMYGTSPAPKDHRVYPGSAHGTSLFSSSGSADLLAVVLAFIQQNVPTY